MIEDLKKLGDKLDRPYQAIMKEAIERGLPIVKELGATEIKIRKESRVSVARNIDAAIEKLRKATASKK